MAIKAGQKAVYALRCLDGRVRYVGQTSDPARRLRHHLVETDKLPHLQKSVWIQGLLDLGLRPELDVLEWVQGSDAIAAERRWIASFPDLTNHLTRSPEHGRKVGDALRGRPAVATQGSKNPSARLTEPQVREIKRLYAEGVRGKQLAAPFDTSTVNAWLIGTGRAWAHLQKGVA